MQFSFDWQGVNIIRINDETRNCLLFIDIRGNEVVVCCDHYAFKSQPLREIKAKVVVYLSNKWVLPQS